MYELQIGTTIVPNSMSYEKFNTKVYPITYDSFQIVKFVIPMKIKVPTMLRLLDRKYSLSYLFPIKEIMNKPQERSGVGVCAYVSSYNSFHEIRSWIAYYKMVGVKNIILYSVNDIIYKSKFHDLIQSGFLNWETFHWPINNYYEKEQRSVQHLQVNSCYYRYRNYFDYIINVDVDEYVVGNSNPFDLPDMVWQTFSKYPSGTLIVNIYIYCMIDRFYHICINQLKTWRGKKF